jgi:hypothetical protein
MEEGKIAPPLFCRGEHEKIGREGGAEKSHPPAIAKSRRGLNFNHIGKIGNRP